jgi:hypothetical protein
MFQTSANGSRDEPPVATVVLLRLTVEPADGVALDL